MVARKRQAFNSHCDGLFQNLISVRCTHVHLDAIHNNFDTILRGSSLEIGREWFEYPIRMPFDWSTRSLRFCSFNGFISSHRYSPCSTWVSSLHKKELYSVCHFCSLPHASLPLCPSPLRKYWTEFTLSIPPCLGSFSLPCFLSGWSFLRSEHIS